MPIQKIPVVHKFGIISHTQRLELQERLLKKSYLATVETQKATHSSRNPFEVTEKFIQDYNSAQSLQEKEKLNEAAYKMLQRIKRRAGLKVQGEGDHVDLPVAWTELSQLAQCKGKIQEDCLDVLIASLDQAPLQRQHIPALFFLAETTLYWLRTDAVHQPYLRTGEIKLLRMGQIVFTRLFYHHMAGQLQGHDEFKNRLYTYLNGFSESQEAYSPYPNALLCVRYINEVGRIIIGDCNVEPGEVKEGDRIHKESDSNDTTQIDSSSVSRISLPPSSPSTRRDNLTQLFGDSCSQHDSRSSHSAVISSSVHDLSATLWHALDVWRCVHHLAGGLKDAVQALGACGQGLAAESWVDGICAMQVLGDAAKGSLIVLKAVQNLARGLKPKYMSGSSHLHDENEEKEALNGDSDETTCGASPSKGSSHHSPHTLSDIFEKSEPFTSPAKSKPTPTKYLESSTEYESTDFHESPVRDPSPSYGGCGMESHHGHKPVSKQQTRSSRATLSNRTREGTECTTIPDTACRAEAGTELGPDGRASQASTVFTFSNDVTTELPGIHGWHWEVAITYADILADICIHGNTSAIQKVALLGTNTEISMLHRTAIIPRCPMPSAGLLDLVYFHAAKESYDGSANDWSWRVRYAAIQGLVKICHCSNLDQTKEGMKNVAWITLVKAHSQESDQRVLEALKVGQVESNIENLISEYVKIKPETIGTKLASGLSYLYLPPLPPPVSAKSPRRQVKHNPKPVMQSEPNPTAKKPLRTSLREEILLATTLYEPPPSYQTRADFDLKRIVEDQWRKELQKQIEEEEEEYRKKISEDKKKASEEQKKNKKLTTANKHSLTSSSKPSLHQQLSY